MALECAGESADGSGESKIEEQLEPASTPLIAVVAVGGTKCRMAEWDRVTVSGVTSVANRAGVAGTSQRGRRAGIKVRGGHGKRSFLTQVLGGRAAGSRPSRN